MEEKRQKKRKINISETGERTKKKNNEKDDRQKEFCRKGKETSSEEYHRTSDSGTIGCGACMCSFLCRAEFWRGQ